MYIPHSSVTFPVTALQVTQVPIVVQSASLTERLSIFAAAVPP